MSFLDASQREALERVRKYLKAQLEDPAPDVSHRMAVSFWIGSAGWRPVGDCTFQPSGEHAEHLVEAAKSDPAAWDAAIALAARALEQGEVVPSALAAFSADVLRGSRCKPGGNSGKFTNLSRDLPLCKAVSMLLEAGFARYGSRGTAPSRIRKRRRPGQRTRGEHQGRYAGENLAALWRAC